MASPYAPPSAPLREHGFLAAGSDGGPIQLRYSTRLAFRMLALWTVSSALLVVSQGVESLQSNRRLQGLLLVIGLVILSLPLRLLVDRRVQLQLDGEGLRYRPWGWKLRPWSTFSDYRITRQGAWLYLEVTARDALVFARDVSTLTRLLGGRRSVAQGRFRIALALLDVPQAVLDAFERHVDRPEPALPVETRAPTPSKPGHSVVLQSGRHRWPQRCLACGAPSTGAIALRGKMRLFRSASSATVPCCTPCGLKRSSAGILMWLLAWGGGAAVFFGMAFAVADRIPPYAWLPVALIASWLPLRLLEDGVRRAMDRRVWGVEDIEVRGDQIEYRLSSADVAREIIELNRVPREPSAVA